MRETIPASLEEILGMTVVVVRPIQTTRNSVWQFPPSPLVLLSTAVTTCKPLQARRLLNSPWQGLACTKRSEDDKAATAVLFSILLQQQQVRGVGNFLSVVSGDYLTVEFR